MDIEHNEGNYPRDKEPDYEGSPESSDQKTGFFSRGVVVKDEDILSRFGKRQKFRVSGCDLVDVWSRLYSLPSSGICSYGLQRGFGLVSTVALTSTLMITWEVITWSVNFEML